MGKAMANILMRGQYDKKGDEVEANTPGFLPALPKDAPRNRLGLAKWLVDPANPLTSRVTVNRFWQEVFGTGIVKTSEDFGIMGTAPSHPELLDWLAVEFRENGWDVKKFFKLMLTSAAYRQAVLTALQEVEDNLTAGAALEREQAVQAEALAAAQRALEVVNNQYRAGTVAYLNVLSAQATALSAQRSLIDVRNRRLAAVTVLLKNVAGRWEPEPGQPPAPN